MTVLGKRLISLAALLLISTVPVACVSNPPSPVNSKLESRVLSRWDALIDFDFDRAYEFFSPAHRKLFPLEHFLSKTGSTVDWQSVKIKDIQFDDKRAEVKLILDYRLDLPMGVGDDFGQISQDMDEVWLWTDGDWWYTSDGDTDLF